MKCEKLTVVFGWKKVMHYREERSVVRKRALKKLASPSEELGLPD